MKRLISFLLSLIICLSFCACTAVPVNAPESEATTVPYLSDEAEQKLIAYAIEFNWNPEVVDIVRTSIPDIETFDKIEPVDEDTFVIIMTDGLEYRMNLDNNGEVIMITANVEIPTERDILYVR